MVPFREATQARLILKMKFAVYSWYHSSRIIAGTDGYSIVVTVSRLDNQVRKIISPVFNGVSVKTELEG